MGIQFTRTDKKPPSIHEELLNILIPTPLATFLFREDTTICIVDRSIRPSSGDQVVVYDENQGFKRISFKNIKEEDIWGVVTWFCHEAGTYEANNSL
ncbi:hypothetical protein RBH88_05315 [Aminobacterium sp. MB27-C1]|uniref:hypothetical protein n=1 Tax=Aminobacterium sp. MB27-C1 TaxID=3070661 RepID=UPI0027DCB4F0|nr:hypothetical protein [Aminobacterium sp. MB27-C1]WMI72523.1 hypothetical protein RBH88_05315 [Aminobacterium sp. MB27-C1]